MRNVTITDIHNRLNSLAAISNSDIKTANIFVESANGLVHNGRVSDIKRLIESAASSNHEIPFFTYMELFDSIVDKGTVSEVNSIGSVITEKAVTKTRDAKHTLTLIRRRLSRAKNKLKSNVYKSLDSIKSKYQTSKHEAAISALEAMEEKAIICINCDRVIENYNKISKRFNLELLFNENIRINGVTDTVIELCRRIDTYSMPDTVKFNTIIETAWYGFESNHIEYSKSEILEAAVDYYAFKPNGLKACKDILEATLFYDKDDDMRNIDILTEEEPEKVTSIGEQIMSYCNPNAPVSIMTESKDFNKIFKEFKENELDDKPETKLKGLINKLYARDVNSIVDETPNLLTWIRSFFIIGSAAVPVIGPVIMIIGFIADKFIQLDKDREEVGKMVKCFTNEIKKSKTKLESTSDPEDKKRLEEYIKACENARDKLNAFHDELISEEELDAKYEDMYKDDTPSFKVDDEFADLFDDFDFDDEFMEASALEKIGNIMTEFTEYSSDHPITDTDIYNLVYGVDDETLTSIAFIASKYPETFYKEAVIDAIDDSISDSKRSKIAYESVYAKALRVTALNTAKEILSEEVDTSKTKTIYEAIIDMDCLNESYRAIEMMINAMSNENTSQFLEASFTNTLRVASMKLKQAMTKLKDKDRQISKSIDIGMNNLTKSAERALTNDNREAIIKGSILPSASKILKLVIANAGLIAIGQPALAVIGTLGYLGTSAKFKAKERQMLTDEIEIELKMCQKYIEIAEQKNDMKALKQLLMIQRDLERQHQRIRYKMKAELGQKYYDAKHVGDQ